MDLGKIILAGGSGFLGRTLSNWFRKRGHPVVVLSRHGDSKLADGARTVLWDGESLGEWAVELEGTQALINLAGRSVNCRYTAANRERIMESRLRSTRILGEAVAQCGKPPRVWLNSSTATIYKHRLDAPNDEDSGLIGATPEAKDAFSIDVALAWEREFDAAPCKDTRKLALRTAMVMGAEPGGVYHVLRRLTRWGLGGRMGNGRQYVSWIHDEDFCRAIDWLIRQEPATGIYNVCAPHPLPNAGMMSTFRTVCRRRIGLPATAWMLELGAFFLRTETELIIKSRRVAPGRLLREGFTFRFPHLKEALEELEIRMRQNG